MTFESRGCVFNLLDTPGHEDFSEATCLTLTAAAAAKGIEERVVEPGRKGFAIREKSPMVQSPGSEARTLGHEP